MYPMFSQHAFSNLGELLGLLSTLVAAMTAYVQLARF